VIKLSWLKLFLFALVALTLPGGKAAAAERQAYTAQFLALAPNAGGQDAFALRMGDDKREWSLFTNLYLRSYDLPLTGITYDWRFPICSMACWVPTYLQAGGGISQAGPLAQLTWSTTVLRLLRIDYTTQAFYSQSRIVLWSYPLWLGLSIQW